MVQKKETTKSNTFPHPIHGGNQSKNSTIAIQGTNIITQRGTPNQL